MQMYYLTLLEVSSLTRSLLEALGENVAFAFLSFHKLPAFLGLRLSSLLSSKSAVSSL